MSAYFISQVGNYLNSFMLTELNIHFGKTIRLPILKWSDVSITIAETRKLCKTNFSL